MELALRIFDPIARIVTIVVLLLMIGVHGCNQEIVIRKDIIQMATNHVEPEFSLIKGN